MAKWAGGTPQFSSVAQLCPTPCDPMNYNLQDSSVRGISQARMLSGLPFPTLVTSPTHGLDPRLPRLLHWQADSLPLRHLVWWYWTLWERARVGWSERIAMKHIYYHMWNRSPVQVRCMRQGSQGWCTGMIQRDGMGREMGGGFRMGNTSTSMANSCQYMAKMTTIL